MVRVHTLSLLLIVSLTGTRRSTTAEFDSYVSEEPA